MTDLLLLLLGATARQSELPDMEVAAGYARSRDGQQVLSRVEAGDASAPLRSDHRSHAGSATGIEIRCL
jgi:hypothetical protein